MPNPSIRAHLFLVGCVASATLFAQPSTPLPATPPEQAAREAFAAGNLRYLKAPACIEAVPLGRATKKLPTPIQVFSRCEDFKLEWQASQAAKWENYARRYNNELFDLRNQRSKP